jgi:hypothetical protein
MDRNFSLYCPTQTVFGTHPTFHLVDMRRFFSGVKWKLNIIFHLVFKCRMSLLWCGAWTWNISELYEIAFFCMPFSLQVLAIFHLFVDVKGSWGHSSSDVVWNVQSCTSILITCLLSMVHRSDVTWINWIYVPAQTVPDWLKGSVLHSLHEIGFRNHLMFVCLPYCVC